MRQQQPKRGSLLGATALTGGLAVLALSLWPGQHGADDAKFVSLTLGGFASLCGLTTLSIAREKARRISRILRAHSQTNDHGSADFLSESEARAEGLDHAGELLHGMSIHS